MLQIQNTLISLDILDKKFVCDLQKCKGACCVKGDAGAPLSTEEVKTIDSVFSKVKPYMRNEGIAAVEKSGKYTIDEEGEFVTTLVKGKECAYAVFTENGQTNCAFELAHKARKTEFIKPLSCHLYPVRIAKYNEFEAVNFHSWDICRPACDCGKELNVKVYRFVKTALIRKFGEAWYRELEIASELMEKSD